MKNEDGKEQGDVESRSEIGKAGRETMRDDATACLACPASILYIDVSMGIYREHN